MFKDMFSGKLKRKDFFWRWAGIFLVMVLLNLIDLDRAGLAVDLSVLGASLLCVIYCFSLTARRLRDAGKNPWLCLLGLIPVVSFFLCLYCLFKGSAPEAPSTTASTLHPLHQDGFSTAAPAATTTHRYSGTMSSAREDEPVADFFSKAPPASTARTAPPAPEMTITEGTSLQGDAALAKEQIDRLKALSELRKDGSISQEEFEHLKRRILQG